jgi:hypothetical protein
MKVRPEKNIRSYGVDFRHAFPMVRDLAQLLTIRALDKKTRYYPIELARKVREYAFDARDPLPKIEHADLAAFLGCTDPPDLILPPIETISLAGLGFVFPYSLLATIAGALQPKKIFETGTFRGVSTLTMALNAPEAEIYTLDLPEQYSETNIATLTKGDKEWVRLSRASTGAAFLDQPAAARIHQLRGDSMTYVAPPELYGTDLCFIDGGHSYECVKADTEIALEILSPNGVILWDDYAWFVDGVKDYLLDLRKSLPIHRIAGSGIAIHKRTGA